MSAAVTTSGTLSLCQALVVAHGEQDTKMMLRLCRSVGFGDAADLAVSGFDSIAAKRVLYTLVHYELGDAAKLKLVSALRRSERPDITFAPIILFVPDIPYEEMLSYIEMGFDDVVCLPEKNDVLSARLEKQLNSEHIYVETPTYIGPDRRRMEVPGTTQSERTGTNEYTRILIRRVPGEGVKIMSRQLHIRGRAMESGTRRQGK
jgi:hypothetical protein